MEENCVELGSYRAGNEGLKHYFSTALTILAQSTNLWSSDLLSNYCELFLVALGLSHEPNASDGIRIGLQTNLKRALERRCTAAVGLSWLSE